MILPRTETPSLQLPTAAPYMETAGSVPADQHNGGGTVLCCVEKKKTSTVLFSSTREDFVNNYVILTLNGIIIILNKLYQSSEDHNYAISSYTSN
uniref:Uncharacterized protein n=1 Tax=Heterorhabditis bacteriophora TaxID=37862 RepID=A0A1I7XAY0_HETBA